LGMWDSDELDEAQNRTRRRTARSGGSRGLSGSRCLGPLVLTRVLLDPANPANLKRCASVGFRPRSHDELADAVGVANQVKGRSFAGSRVVPQRNSGGPRAWPEQTSCD